MSTKETANKPCYGPLEGLIGTWAGDKGMDLAPEPDGSESTPYYETIVFEGIGELSNAEEQTIAALHYRQIVRKKLNDEVFHDQTGYWMWDAEAQVVMQSLTIPRGVCVLAGAKYTVAKGEAIELEVLAKLDDEAWGLIQSPFMQSKAKTLGFLHRIKLQGDRMSYFETTSLEIYGRGFEHTDQNELTRQKDA